MTHDQNDENIYILWVFISRHKKIPAIQRMTQHLYYTFTRPYFPGLFRFRSLFPWILPRGLPSHSLQRRPPAMTSWPPPLPILHSSAVPLPLLLPFHGLLWIAWPFVTFLSPRIRVVCSLSFCLGMAYFVNKASFESKVTFYIHMHNTNFACN